jgi:glutaredoxin-related protein
VILATPGMLQAVSTEPTTPRVFVDGKLLGGAEDLADWLAGR